MTMVSRQWEVFHLIVEEGSHCIRYRDRTVSAWQNLLGQNAILLADHQKMGEVIVSTLQVMAGHDKSKVVSSWDGNTSLVVERAIRDLRAPGKADANGIVTL